MITRTQLPIWILTAVLALPVHAVPGIAPAGGCAVPPVTSAGQTATLLPDGRWLLLGGLADGLLTDRAEIFDPSAGTTAALPTHMLFVRAFHTATVLPDGTVFIFGGERPDGGDHTTAEVFDPAAASFTLYPYVTPAPRSHHTATLLTSGELFIAGGSGKGDAVVFDPARRTITRADNAPEAASYDASSMLLSDGTVLLWNGVDPHGVAVPGAVLFHPAERRFDRSDGAGADRLPMASIAPEVIASIPSDQELAVPVNARIAVRFSKCLDITSIHAGTVTLIGPAGKTAIRVVGTNDGQQLFVTLAAELMPAAHYTLFMSGLTDGAQEVPFTAVDFTTAAILPSDPEEEVWEPSAEHFAGNWKIRETRSPWIDLPPLHAADGVTALAGQVLKVNGIPLPNTTLSLGGRTTRTDRTGRFLLTDIPDGAFTLIIDGRTANRGNTSYGLYQARVEIVGRRTNVLDYTIWMTALDTRNMVDIASPTRSETVVSTPLIPNLELHIPAGIVIRDLDGKIVTRIGITPIPVNRPPFPLPDVHVPVYFTIQPGGAVLQARYHSEEDGARLIYPNFDRLPAGGKVNFWNYDAHDKGWYVYGQGTVSEDRLHAVPDPEVEIYEFTGAMIADPQNPGAPEKSPTAGGEKGGEPVDLSTGLFIYEHTDLYLPDVIPLVLTRSFNSGDGQRRAFGISTNFEYGMFLYGQPGKAPTDLFLADGSNIKYTCISGCDNYATAVLQAQKTPTRFYLSTIRYQRTVQFGYSLTLLDGTTYYFLGDAYATHGLAAIRDRYGNQVTVTGSGEPITKVTSPNGRWIAFAYGNASYPNFITSATDSAGRTVKYAYDSAGRLVTVTDANGGITTYSYDAANRIVSITDPRRIKFITNVYDSSGRVADQTLGDGKSRYHFDYTSGTGGVVSKTNLTDPNGNVRSVVFNADGQATSDTRAAGTPLAQTTKYERGVGGNPNLVRSFTDALNRTTTYTYDAVGNITGVTYLSATAKAVTWKFTYEPQFQQLLTIVNPLALVTSFIYDGNARLTQIVDPLGHRTSFGYDDRARLKSVINPLGHTIAFTYVGADLVALTNALGQTTTRFADAAGRTVTLTDPLGNQTAYGYDNNDNILTVTDPLGHRVTLTYDPNDNVTSVTNPNSGTTRYTYDALGYPAVRTDPLGRTDTFAFNGIGNLLQHTDRKGQITTRSYDALDRLKQIIYADSSSIALTWDAGNRAIAFADSLNGSITRSYDELDRLTQESSPQGSMSYVFDAANRRTGMSVAGGLPVNYAYDGASRLVSVMQGNALVSMVYDDANRLASLTLPNGVVAQYDYDGRNMLTSLSYRKGSALLDTMVYGYDGGGRNTSFVSTLLQLDKAVAAKSGGTFNATNQLLTFTGVAYTYDNNGNLTSDGVNRYSWNARNQLVGITGGVSSAFAYDAVGRRTQRTVGGVTTAFLHDGANLVQETSGGKTARYLTGLRLDQVFSRTDSTATMTYLRDGLGSIFALADGTGAIATQYQYDPYGNTATSGAPSPNTLQYTGRENDGTGLYFYRARYYSPALGRFISQDPIGLAGGMNVYSYVGNNPVNFIDPLGLYTVYVSGGFHIPFSPGVAVGPNATVKVEVGTDGAKMSGDFNLDWAFGTIWDFGVNAGVEDISSTGGQCASPFSVNSGLGTYSGAQVTPRRSIDPDQPWWSPYRYIDGISLGVGLGLSAPVNVSAQSGSLVK